MPEAVKFRGTMAFTPLPLRHHTRKPMYSHEVVCFRDGLPERATFIRVSPKGLDRTTFFDALDSLKRLLEEQEARRREREPRLQPPPSGGIIPDAQT